jgi:parallel beta-helix repeat protein
VLHITDTGNLMLNDAIVKEGKVSVYPSNGGGINNMGGVISLIDCTVSGNNTFADPSYPVSYGGGIYNSGGTVTLTNSTVSGNTASSYGGGIFNVDSGTATLTNSTISGNSANDPNAGGGGGIANVSGSTITLTNSTVSGNTASSYYGGGIYNAGGTATLTNSTISGNTASSSGGGIYNYSGTVTLTNSTVSGNTSNSTVSGGGGIYNKSTVKLHSSIISGNMAGAGNEVNNDSRVTADSFNVFGSSEETDVQAFAGLVGFTPGLSDVNATSDGGGTPTELDAILTTTLADNGGLTQTHALVAGSPAIDLDTVCSIY